MSGVNPWKESLNFAGTLLWEDAGCEPQNAKHQDDRLL